MMRRIVSESICRFCGFFLKFRIVVNTPTSSQTTAGSTTMYPTALRKSRNRIYIQKPLPHWQQRYSSNIGITTTPVRTIHSGDLERRSSLENVSERIQSLTLTNANASNDLRKIETFAVSGEMKEQQEPSAANWKVKKTSNDFNDPYWCYDTKIGGFHYHMQGFHMQDSRGWHRHNFALGNQKQYKDGQPYMWVDPNPVYHNKIPPYTYQYSNKKNHFSPCIQYYDPKTDGYYYKTPSVEIWKSREVLSSNSTFVPPLSKYPNNIRMPMNLAMLSPPIITHAIDVPRTLRSVNTAKKQLAPFAVTTTDTATNDIRNVNPTLKSTFSSSETSFPPLSSVNGFSGKPLLMLCNETRANSVKGNCGGDSALLRSNAPKPLSYADVVAKRHNESAAVIAEDVANSFSPPQINSTYHKQPKTPNLCMFAKQTDPVVAATNEGDRNRFGLINFNADKFIASLPFSRGTERAVLNSTTQKMPCSVQPMCNCNMDFSRTPVVTKELHSLGISNHRDSEVYDALFSQLRPYFPSSF